MSVIIDIMKSVITIHPSTKSIYDVTHTMITIYFGYKCSHAGLTNSLNKLGKFLGKNTISFISIFNSILFFLVFWMISKNIFIYFIVSYFSALLSVYKIHTTLAAARSHQSATGSSQNQTGEQGSSATSESDQT